MHERPTQFRADLLALSLVAAEAHSGPGEAPTKSFTPVTEKLRASLMEVVGLDGYAALLRRAVVLASAKFPDVAAVQIDAEARLQGVDALKNQHETVIEITEKLLGLLATFIGEALTLRLVRNICQSASVEE